MFSLGLVMTSKSDSGGAFNFEKGFSRLVSGVAEVLGVELHRFEVDTVGNRVYRISSGERKVVGPKERCFTRFGSLLKPMSPEGGRDKVSRVLDNLGLDLLCFASPHWSARGVSNIPFIFPIWDLGHRDLPELPEFRGSSWITREYLYSSALPRAFHVLTDSESTGLRIQNLYGVSDGRWSSIGVRFPESDNFERIADPHRFVEGPYFIYPAKRWAHKNHIMLLEAFSHVVAKVPAAKLVLTGSRDGGAQPAIDRAIQTLGLQHCVIDFGLVEEEVLRDLIQCSSGLLMPSLLGPTNIPPLQALSLGVRPIVSSVHQFSPSDQGQMVVVDSEDTLAWSDAMLRELRNNSCPVSYSRADDSAATLIRILQLFAQRRRLSLPG